jgi:hypothetical protein
MSNKTLKVPVYKVGDRVGAICSANGERVAFFGYGTYQGDHVPDQDYGPFCKMLRAEGIANPKIVLDSGEVVYGCECWWGAEAVVHERIERWRNNGVKILEVSIKEQRLLAEADKPN